MIKQCVAAMMGLALSTAAFSQTCQSPEMAYKIKNEAFSNSNIEASAHFSTDYLGSRLAASQQKLRAEREMVAMLDSMGFANVRVEKAYDFPKGGWDNERNYVAMTAPYYCSFAANPMAWSGSTAGLVSGECVLFDPETVADLAKFSGKLAGKIVLMPSTQEYQLSLEPTGFRYTEEQLAEMAQDPRPGGAWGRWRGGRPDRTLAMAKDSMIKAEKPLAVMQAGGQFNVPSSRGVQYKVGDPEPVPSIILPVEDHGRMVRLVKNGTPVKMELDVRNRFTDNQQINNVYAEIPGTDPKLKNEIVLIGGHFDSWHGGTGGADNASGFLPMIEAMRILKALDVKPRRTIRLALWGGEEQGLYGSRGYANNKLYDNAAKKKLPGYDDFALYLNIDNGSGRFRGIYTEENDMAKPFFETWGAPLKELGFTTISPRQTGSTDHVSFKMLGLPAYQFIQDPLDYFRTYHTTMDTYERLSLDDLKVNAAMAAWLAYCAAMDPDRIPAKPGMSRQ